MNDDRAAISRETIFTVHAADAEGYYKLIVTVATAFLGGSLIFIEKFLPDPTWWSFGFLLPGWLCLIGAIARVTQVRRSNLTAARLALEQKFEESSQIGTKSDKQSTEAARLLIAGMCFMVLAGLVALGGKIMTSKKAAPQAPARVIRTIHYGSTGPQQGGSSSSGGSSGTGASGGTTGGSGSTGTQSGGAQSDKK